MFFALKFFDASEAAAKIHPGHEAVARLLTSEETPPTRIMRAGFMPAETTGKNRPKNSDGVRREGGLEPDQWMTYQPTQEKRPNDKIHSGDFERLTGDPPLRPIREDYESPEGPGYIPWYAAANQS